MGAVSREEARLRSTVLAFAAAGLLAAPLAASGAAPFPSRVGASGLLHVPDAEVAPPGFAAVSLDLRIAVRPDRSVTPSPASIVAGLRRDLELGFSIREGGLPGDEGRPSPFLLGAATKLRLTPPRGRLPGVAIGLAVDEVNRDTTAGARLIASTDASRTLRAAVFLGAAAPPRDPGAGSPSAGLAAALALSPRLELATECAYLQRGAVLSGALRWRALGAGGFQLGATWLPASGGVQLTLGLSVSTPAKEHVAAAAGEDEDLGFPGGAPAAATAASDALDEPTRGRLIVPPAVTPRTPKRARPGSDAAPTGGGAGDGPAAPPAPAAPPPRSGA